MEWQSFNVVGHRGASGEAPENTMAAFTRAQQLGAGAIEFDVHQTSDGELVVIHDYLIDRTTDGSGVVFEKTWADLANLDAGSWFDGSFRGERIPRLHDVLELDTLDFELEIKGHGRSILDAVIAAVDDADVVDRVKFTGWNIPLLRELKRRRPWATIGLFSRSPEPWMTESIFEHITVGSAVYLDFDVAHVYAAAITPSIVDRLHEQGKRVQANDAATVDEALRAVAAGADHVSANDVAGVVAALSDS